MTGSTDQIGMIGAGDFGGAAMGPGDVLMTGLDPALGTAENYRRFAVQEAAGPASSGRERPAGPSGSKAPLLPPGGTHRLSTGVTSSRT